MKMPLFIASVLFVSSLGLNAAPTEAELLRLEIQRQELILSSLKARLAEVEKAGGSPEVKMERQGPNCQSCSFEVSADEVPSFNVVRADPPVQSKIAIDEKGCVCWNDDPVSDQELTTLIETLPESSKVCVVVVPDTPLTSLIQIVDGLKEKGVQVETVTSHTGVN